MAIREALNRFAVDESGWLESERRRLVAKPCRNAKETTAQISQPDLRLVGRLIGIHFILAQ